MADYGYFASSYYGTSTSGGWGSGYYNVSIEPAPVEVRSDAQQLNEGWDADQNPS